jgi:acylphosphatase
MPRSNTLACGGASGGTAVSASASAVSRVGVPLPSTAARATSPSRTAALGIFYPLPAPPTLPPPLPLGSYSRFPELHAFTFIVYGHVQGVGFRKATARAAIKLGMTGWVRNVEEGETVEGAAEGSAQSVAELKRWLSEDGSPPSRIDAATFADAAGGALQRPRVWQTFTVAPTVKVTT